MVSTVLKITSGGQIFRVLFEKSPDELDYEAVKAAAADLCGLDSRSRYLDQDGASVVLSEETFRTFQTTATRSTHSASVMLLRLNVVEIETPKTSAWQEDLRDLDELLAQFDEPDKRNRKKRKKRMAKTKSQTRNSNMEASGTQRPLPPQSLEVEISYSSTTAIEDLSQMEMQTSQPPQVDIGVSDVDDDSVCGLAVDNRDEASDDDVLVRAASCPPTLGEDLVAEVDRQDEASQLWPATPESTPPQSPRAVVWVPAVPVFMWQAVPIDFDHCNEVDCPVDCGWGVWSDWSHCTASCDGGTRQRGKPIKVQNNSLGKPCNMAEGIQVEDCGTSPCPRDCTWADWTKWGECSTTCAGGVKLRSRSIAEAAIADGKKCEGATQDEEVCNVKARQHDCVLADWSNWKACSVTCGNGTSLRERKVLVKEEGGGRPCSEPLEEEVPCTEKVCPVDCSWGDWSDLWEQRLFVGYEHKEEVMLIGNSGPNAAGHVVRGPRHWQIGTELMEAAFRRCSAIGLFVHVVTTAELIRKGYASQITGAMHIITEDPVNYAANPLVEQVSREALAEFAELPVRRVHVSMMPDTMKPRDVVNWFSMLVPNSTNLTAVLDYISKKDLTYAGRILRNKLRRVGVLILVNISKLYVNAHGHKETDSTVLVNTTTGAPLPAWNNPNATRLTGVVKMIVPEPLKFAEDLKTKEATEQLLAELSGIAKPGVRASLIPDQVYRYEAEFGEDADAAESQAAKRKIPSDSIRNKSGEDLKAVTVRNNLLLEAAGRLDAQTKVIQILAKADGDQEEVEENVLDQAPGQVRVTGVVEMVTDYPKSFSADRRSEEVPPETPLDDKDAFSNEVSAWFVITVPPKDERTPDEIAEKLRDQDLTIAGLKIQNCIMDEGLDLSVKVGRITAMVQTTTTTTLGTGVIKKVDFHGDTGPEGATDNKTSAAAAAAAAKTVPGSSSVVGADASTPAKVIAVVAAVSPNDVEPPTMSNPGSCTADGWLGAAACGVIASKKVKQRLQKRNAVQPCKTAATGGGTDAAKDIEKGTPDPAAVASNALSDVVQLCDKIRIQPELRMWTVLESEAQQGATMKELEDRVDGILKLSKNAAWLQAVRLQEGRRGRGFDVARVGSAFLLGGRGYPTLQVIPVHFSSSSGHVGVLLPRRTPSSSNRSGSTDRDAEQSRAEAADSMASAWRVQGEREEQSREQSGGGCAWLRFASRGAARSRGVAARPPAGEGASGAHAERALSARSSLCPSEAPLPPPLPPANLEPIGDEAGHPRLQNCMSMKSMKWHKVWTDRQAMRCTRSSREMSRICRRGRVTAQFHCDLAEAQTTELHRQLRDTRQQSAEAILRLQSQVKELSGNLAEARHQEQQWASIAKHQRAYLQQSERISQEGMQILRRHPAGLHLKRQKQSGEELALGIVAEVFGAEVVAVLIAIPTSSIRGRSSVPPNLNHWEEGDEDYDDVDEDLDEDEHPHWQWDEQADPDEDTSSLEPERMKAPSACRGQRLIPHSFSFAPHRSTVGRGSTLPPLTVDTLASAWLHE
ncbi:HMCN1 [Symbiodinium sp. CCMP2456]|nr:HMCN1 [Symbiodinium sp. CCMP2456]